MAQTYSQVAKQIATLQAKAEQLKQREVSGVVTRIKDAIKAYGLTTQQLFGSMTAKQSKPGKAKAKTKKADKSLPLDSSVRNHCGRGPIPPQKLPLSSL